MTKAEKAEKRTFLLWGIFAVYSMLTLICALNHEVWLDEAQAWVIVRDCPLPELAYRLKAEGHPPLWYLVLFPFVRLGFPAEYASLISWFFMALGALVLLFRTELPLMLKAAVLASSGFLYFNSVILRVYCLIPLILFLILWAYPGRREHPLVYGSLVALLANTHIFMCGIVGTLGIFMIYELFSQWKDSSSKENAGKISGLVIAGTGVLLLVIPLLGSTQVNSTVKFDLSFNLINTIVDTLYAVFSCSFYPSGNRIVCLIAFFITEIAFLAVLVMLRHWRRAFAVEVIFLAFYFLTCGVIWTTNPNRAAILVLSFAFSLGLAQHETPVFKERKNAGKNLGKLVEKLISVDRRSMRIYTGILTAFFALTVPAGARFLCSDTAGNFSGAKDTAEYILENLEDDAVFVTFGRVMPEISLYAPDIKMFDVNMGDFATYSHWEYRFAPKEDTKTVSERLTEYDHLYFLMYKNETFNIKAEPIYVSAGMTEYDGKNSLVIYEYDEDILKINL